MPIFEYRCRKCEYEFEELVLDRKISVKCPKCGAGRPEKKFSVFAHKSESGFTPSSGGSSCSGCTSSSCSGCSH